MLVRARSLAVVLLILVLASPAFLHTTPAAAASQPSTTLSVGVVTSSPIESMNDLNNINSINEAFFGVLSGFDTAVNIRPYYHLLTSTNDTFQPEEVISTQLIASNNTYILHLRNDTHWNNGQPVTAWDFAAYGTIIGGLGAPAYNYDVINNYTVSVSVPNTPAVGLYGLTVSSFIFGPDLANGPFILNYNQWLPIYNEVKANYPAIQAGNATVIQKLSTAIFAYNTTQALFSGPYMPTAISGSEIVLSKNPGYWDTANLLVNQIDIYQFSSSSALYSYLDNGELSMYFVSPGGSNGGSGSIPQSFVNALPSYMKAINTQGYSGPGIFFNNATGVVSNLNVRDAIAYALNRTELAEAGGSTYSPVTVPIGMAPYMWPVMCPSACQSQMNPYSNNLATAKQDMEAAGYTLKGGQWTFPNGTAITLTMVNTFGTDPSSLNVALDLQTQLQNFGIGVNVLNPASAGTYETSGKGYDIMLGQWGYWFETWDTFRYLQYFNGIPYPVMHFTANVTIPYNNLGSVNPIALQDLLLDNSQTVAQESTYAQELSYLVNHYLPYLPLLNQAPVMYVNTQQFNWPDGSSPTWSGAITAGGVMDSLMPIQEGGLLSLASGASTSSSATTSSSASTSTSSTFISPPPSTSVTSTTTSTSGSSSSALNYYILPVIAIAALVMVAAGVQASKRRSRTGSGLLPR